MGRRRAPAGSLAEGQEVRNPLIPETHFLSVLALKSNICVSLDPVLLVTLKVSPFLVFDFPRYTSAVSAIFGGLLFLQVSPFQVFNHPGANICGIADQLVEDLRRAQDCWPGACDITGSPEGIAERDGMTRVILSYF